MTVTGSANVNLDEGAIVEIGTLPGAAFSRYIFEEPVKNQG